MKNFRWWPALGMTAAAVALTGCGNSGSSSDTSVRIANATLTHASLDLLINSGTAVTGDATDTISNYATGGSGSVTLQVNDTGGTTALNTSVPTLAGGSHYTLLAYESGGAVKTALLSEDFTTPAANVTTLRIYDAAVEAGKLDIYITTLACTAANLATLSPSTSFGALTAPAAVSQAQGSGAWNICATGSGSKTDIRMAFAVTLPSATVATVVLTPASGGSLLNGSLVVQQGAYSASRNTNTRVRLAAAVANSTVVAATATSGTSSTVIDAGTASPAFGFYTLVPAGSSLNVTAGGQSVGAPSGTLAAGADVTLLVYGPATAPLASLIADDNRPPTDATTTKLRLINGINGSTTNALTLTANASPIGINILPGTASAYGTTTVNATTNAVSLVLSSSAAGTYVTPTAPTTLSPNTTYTILAGDPAAATPTQPQLFTR